MSSLSSLSSLSSSYSTTTEESIEQPSTLEYTQYDVLSLHETLAPEQYLDLWEKEIVPRSYNYTPFYNSTSIVPGGIILPRPLTGSFLRRDYNCIEKSNEYLDLLDDYKSGDLQLFSFMGRLLDLGFVRNLDVIYAMAIDDRLSNNTDELYELVHFIIPDLRIALDNIWNAILNDMTILPKEETSYYDLFLLFLQYGSIRDCAYAFTQQQQQQKPTDIANQTIHHLPAGVVYKPYNPFGFPSPLPIHHHEDDLNNFSSLSIEESKTEV